MGLGAQDFHNEVEVQRGTGRIEIRATSFERDFGTALMFDRENRRIRLMKKTLLPEDDIAFRFVRVLDEVGVRYVVVAGYVAILFGRARRSDDVDFIVEQIDENRFVELCREARKHGFVLMQGDIGSEDSVRRVYRDYLAEGLSVRFMYGDIIVPNIEFKMVWSIVERYALEHSIIVKVEVDGRYTIRVSPIELQIAHKLYLGSEKDVGDAVFLYTLFRDALDSTELERWCRELNVDCSVLGGV